MLIRINRRRGRDMTNASRSAAGAAKDVQANLLPTKAVARIRSTLMYAGTAYMRLDSDLYKFGSILERKHHVSLHSTG